MNRKALILPGLVLALAVPGYAVMQKERLLAGGETVLLELAPVDPRSLIQGDYMRLNYAITRTIEEQDSWPRDGAIVVRVDSNRVATFVRRADASGLGSGELLLRYRKRDRRVRVATDAFYFQEGDAPRYVRARYGELKVDSDGSSVLVGMRDSLAAPIR